MPKIKPLFKSKAEVSPNCEKCGLYKGCSTPRMGVSGKGEQEILIIAEAPGKTEDERGVQLIGQAGQELRRRLKEQGFSLDRDFWKINAVNCRPPKNRKPTFAEMEYCYPKINKVIQDLKPKAIFLMGSAAIETFYKKMFSDCSVSVWRGLSIPDRERNAWVFPMFHPSYIIRKDKDVNLSALFNKDLKDALMFDKDKEFPELKPLNKAVKIIRDLSTLKKEMQIMLESKYTSIDYETTRLKPYAGGKILTAAIANDDYAISFPVAYPKAWTKKEYKTVRQLLRKYLKAKTTRKIGHNYKYEDIWSYCFLGTRIKYGKACTMNDAHLIDSRKGAFREDQDDIDKGTGLKFLAFICFGVHGYEKEMKKYMPKGTRSGYTDNRLHEMPIDNLLLYNGMDSYLTQKVFNYQQSVFKNSQDLRRIRKLFFKSTKALASTQLEGICIDEEYLHSEKVKYKEEANRIFKELMSSKEAKLFKQKENRDFDYKSTEDLRILFYKVLKFKADKVTKSGQQSVDQETLHTWEEKSEIVAKILRLRKLDKVVGTYIAQFERETCNGKMHPNFNLHVATTGRSCIAKGTMVEVVRDFKKHPYEIPIENIKPGDLVYAYDENCNLCLKKVKWAGKTGHKKVVRVHWTSKWSNRKGYVDMTPEHKIRVVTGEYIPACEIIDGDFRKENDSFRNPKRRVLALSRNDKGTVEHSKSHTIITKVEHLNKSVDVYDLEIEDVHNFIADGICVHNSSSEPNFQNIPVRDEFAKAAIRKGIMPSKGRKITEVDFGSLEVRIIACYSQDPVLVNYIRDKSTDMHRDMAIELFVLDQFEGKKDKVLRFFAKNGFVFPEFYGSYYANCARNLIENCWHLETSEDIKIKDHLKNKGVRSKDDFVEHVKKVEERFWKKFPRVKEWQQEQLAFFKKFLHTKSHFGYQCRGHLSNNDLINYPIQGAAFHCLLWCFNEIHRLKRINKWETKIIGQIHDSIVFDLLPEEENEIVQNVKQVMETDLKEAHDWMIVPMEAEIEMTEIDQAWYYKKEVKL